MLIAASSVPSLRPPILRHVEVAGPHIDLASSCRILASNVFLRRMSMCDGPAVCHQPAFPLAPDAGSLAASTYGKTTASRAMPL